MNGFILSLIACLNATAFASTNQYRIETRLFVDGKLISSPQIVTRENEAAEISETNENPRNQVKIKVVASDVSDERVKDEVLMKFDVEYASDHRWVKSAPQVLAKPGSEATIRVADRQGDRDVQMKVIVTRQ
jgi:hypothetical protein